MTFAPVKSDPWKKGKRRRIKRGELWSAEFWKRLVKQAEKDMRDDAPSRWISPACVEMIVGMNQLLYGEVP